MCSSYPNSDFSRCPNEVPYGYFPPPPVLGLAREHAHCCPASLVSRKLGEGFVFAVSEENRQVLSGEPSVGVNLMFPRD